MAMSNNIKPTIKTPINLSTIKTTRLIESNFDENQLPDKTIKGLFSDIYKEYEKNPNLTLSNDPIYKEIDDIKIYDNTTPNSRVTFAKRNGFYSNELKKHAPLFSPLEPSTLTVRGTMDNVSFNEEDTFQFLTPPTGYIVSFGCNYGEKYNPQYIKEEKKKVSGRGRKPKPKLLTKRKKQGTGKYFSSQITFVIMHPKTGQLLQIKLFRNGIFQVPGIQNPSMIDLVEPIQILCTYLESNFNSGVRVDNFVAVMRNYKAKLLNPNIHVNLEKLEEIIIHEKDPARYTEFVDKVLIGLSLKHKNNLLPYIKNFNPLNIAEMVYNMDRCFCLIIKFYRPSLFDPTKKTTVKLLKKGKINFDGGNSQQEVEELHHWFTYLYIKYEKQILYDVTLIKNETPIGSSDDSDLESIYDEIPITKQKYKKSTKVKVPKDKLAKVKVPKDKFPKDKLNDTPTNDTPTNDTPTNNPSNIKSTIINDIDKLDLSIQENFDNITRLVGLTVPTNRKAINKLIDETDDLIELCSLIDLGNAYDKHFDPNRLTPFKYLPIKNKLPSGKNKSIP